MLPFEKPNSPTFSIFYVLALPDWKPEHVTPFQGFAPDLINFVPCLDFLPTLPADILELLLEQNDRLARRRAGSGSWLWSPVNLSTLIAKRKPTAEHPFMVLFSVDRKTAKIVTSWRRDLRIKPIHLSFHKVEGAMHPASFTVEILRQKLILLAKKAAEVERDLDISEHLTALNSWQIQNRRPSSLKFHSHNVTKPNEMALIGAGEEPPHDEGGQLKVASSDEYIRGITESAEAVIKLWSRTKSRPAYFLMPPRPDIFLIAPAMFRGISKRLERVISTPILKTALRALDRQKDYVMPMAVDDKNGQVPDSDIKAITAVLGIRGAEMKLTTSAVGLRTAGTLAATIRLPPAINRTAGVVDQFSSFLRKHENPPRSKSARVFKIVQDALLRSIPEPHLKLIAQSQAGIKIVADAPLEWLPIDGLPLGIRFNVSRINTTPGNLFLQQIRPPMPIFIPPNSFRKYRVLSMFEEGDQIAHHLRIGASYAMDADGSSIVGEFVSPKTIEQFAAAIASFDGPMLIIDAHGEHKEGDVSGGLIIEGKPFDVWSLAGKIQIPPIVILSACDTHPFDRSHATIANGFLACGALAVVGTALPIRANQAARFIMRLLNRAVHFGSILNGMGQGVSWTEIVGGVLRMEFVTEIIRGFEAVGCFDEITAKDLLLQTNNDLNPLKMEWYELFVERVFAQCKRPRELWERQLQDIVAASDAIRYLHLGNPEAVIVADDQVAARAFGWHKEMMKS